MSLRTLLRAAATCLIAGSVLCGCSLAQARNAIIIDTDSTSGPARTLPAFAVSGPWQIKYTFDCTKQNAEGIGSSNVFALDVLNGDDNSTASENPQTILVSVRRQGTLDFATPGDYYLHIDSQCDWTLKVLDLSGGPVGTPSPSASVTQPHGTVPLDVTFAADFGAYNCTLTGTPALVCQVGDGTAGSSPFGALTMHRTVAAQAPAGDCATASTAGTLTAGNGDVLDIRADSGQACRKAGTDSFTFTVTGGTGIFKGATGSGTIGRGNGGSDRWSGSVTFAS